MSRGVHMKRIIVAGLALSALTASTLIVSPSASAVDTKNKTVKSAKVPAIKCTPTKAVGHTPPSVAPADKVLKRIPRTFTFVTNCGNIVVTTVGAKAPITLTQLSTLARGGYFNNSLCHRLTTQGLYVLQCGDPTATGGGGPNFTYRDENLPAEGLNNYPAGTVAMANSGPGTNGSQFFLVFADTTLGANYTIWGTVTQGLEIVKAIAKAGVKGGGADGAPSQQIEIKRVTVSN
jgi:peptidyl-prolyl cis-trans isomerase B (cyclophilin B)